MTLTSAKSRGVDVENGETRTVMGAITTDREERKRGKHIEVDGAAQIVRHVFKK